MTTVPRTVFHFFVPLPTSTEIVSYAHRSRMFLFQMSDVCQDDGASNGALPVWKNDAVLALQAAILPPEIYATEILGITAADDDGVLRGGKGAQTDKIVPALSDARWICVLFEYIGGGVEARQVCELVRQVLCNNRFDDPSLLTCINNVMTQNQLIRAKGQQKLFAEFDAAWTNGTSVRLTPLKALEGTTTALAVCAVASALRSPCEVALVSGTRCSSDELTKLIVKFTHSSVVVNSKDRVVFANGSKVHLKSNLVRENERGSRIVAHSYPRLGEMWVFSVPVIVNTDVPLALASKIASTRFVVSASREMVPDVAMTPHS